MKPVRCVMTQMCRRVGPNVDHTCSRLSWKESIFPQDEHSSCILSYIARNLRISQPAWIYLSMELICTQNACDIQTVSKCSTRRMDSYLVTELCTEQSGCKEQFM